MADGRQHIINFARQLIGSHYLWGAAGNHPNFSDGAWYRKNAVTLARTSLDPQDPCVFTAQCDVDGHYVCAGRVDKVPGGRSAGAHDQDLIDYLEKLQDLSKEFWDPAYSNFTPRRVHGKDNAYDGCVVWAEDCRFRRHFDCIHFINYVLSKTIKPDWQLNIEGWIKQGTPVAMNAAPVPGDILAKGNHHIGFLCEDGHVIQAQDHATGVHQDEKYVPSDWTARSRLPDSLLMV